MKHINTKKNIFNITQRRYAATGYERDNKRCVFAPLLETSLNESGGHKWI
jgi:hypothetical protein